MTMARAIRVGRTREVTSTYPLSPWSGIPFTPVPTSISILCGKRIHDTKQSITDMITEGAYAKALQERYVSCFHGCFSSYFRQCLDILWFRLEWWLEFSKVPPSAIFLSGQCIAREVKIGGWFKVTAFTVKQTDKDDKVYTLQWTGEGGCFSMEES